MWARAQAGRSRSYISPALRNAGRRRDPALLRRLEGERTSLTGSGFRWIESAGERLNDDSRATDGHRPTDGLANDVHGRLTNDATSLARGRRHGLSVVKGSIFEPSRGSARTRRHSGRPGGLIGDDDVCAGFGECWDVLSPPRFCFAGLGVQRRPSLSWFLLAARLSPRWSTAFAGCAPPPIPVRRAG